MNQTLASLVVLRTNWETSRKDYIECFLPFIATLFWKKQYSSFEIINVHNVCEQFKEEFGLIVPYHAMITILNRATKRGIIKRDTVGFIPVKGTIREFEFSEKAKEQVKKFKLLTVEFINYCNAKFKKEISQAEAEEAIINYLKKHDLDILFASQERSILPNVQQSNDNIYMLCKFLQHIHENNIEIFKIAVSIAVGHTLASSILYDKINLKGGKLLKINCYFDTRFIFRLLGMEGEPRENSYVNFIKDLKERGANLFIFQHTYEEIDGILKNCAKWIDSPDYDPSKASFCLRYFVQESYTSFDIERFILSLDNKLEEYEIKVVDKPSYSDFVEYQIDEAKLEDIIVNKYKAQNPLFNELDNAFSINRDINSISSVYKLRQGNIPQNIYKTKYAFITTNSSLAFSVRKFEDKGNQNGSFIPACLTDVFLGTVIWLNSPAKADECNASKLMADSYAAIEPDYNFLKKLVDSAEKLLKIGKIDENEYYILRSSAVIKDMLLDKTLGDTQRFDDKTIDEVLREYEITIKAESEKELAKEKKRHDDTKSMLKITKHDKDKLDNLLVLKSERIAEMIRKILLYGLWLFVIIISILQFYLASSTNLYPKLISLSLLLILTLASLGFGLNIKNISSKFKNYLKDVIYSYLKG